MFHKGFSTVACMDLDDRLVIAACKVHGMTGVEVRLGDNGSVFGLTDENDLQKMKTEFEKNKIVITDLGSSACFAGYDEGVMQTAKQAVDRAATLRCRAIRVFLGYFAARVNPGKPEPDYDGIVRALKELCDDAKNKNVEVWVETHNEFATGKVLKPLLEDVNKENLKIIWDVIHPIEDGESVEETWAQIGKSIVHVHIKDGINRHDPLWHDFRYTRLGEGELPLYRILDLLQRNGYDGYLSLEWETAWRPELKALSFSFDDALCDYNEFLDGFAKQSKDRRCKG